MSTIETLAVDELKEEKEIGNPLLGGSLEVVKNVKVKLEVRLGEGVMSIEELMGLKKNSVVKIGRTLGEPVDILLDGHVIARGQLVSADGNFGVQISQVCQADG